MAIKNKTVRTLKNGVVIPTALSMERRIAKIYNYMFKDKTIRAILFGGTAQISDTRKNRVTTFNFPATSDEDKTLSISYPSADGIVLYLLKRINSLESRIAKLESKKK